MQTATPRVSSNLRIRIFTVDADAKLRQQIERALTGTGYLALREIAIDVRDGTATLNGNVPTYYLKQVAQCAVLSSVQDVGRLANEIQVTWRRGDLPH